MIQTETIQNYYVEKPSFYIEAIYYRNEITSLIQAVLNGAEQEGFRSRNMFLNYE